MDATIDRKIRLVIKIYDPIYQGQRSTSKQMSTDLFSLSELPADPRPDIFTPLDVPLVSVLPAIKPLELWAFLENSDFVRRKDEVLYRQDEVRLIRHDEFLETDYQLLIEAGCIGVRDAAWWYVSHPAPGSIRWLWQQRNTN